MTTYSLKQISPETFRKEFKDKTIYVSYHNLENVCDCTFFFTEKDEILFIKQHKKTPKHLENRTVTTNQKQGDTLFQKMLNGNDLSLITVGTEFQSDVWKALLNIKCGDVVTYHDIAKEIGREKSYRATANAVGANPIPVIIPCHRVIRKSGALGGFGWGSAAKIALLKRENVTIQE